MTFGIFQSVATRVLCSTQILKIDRCYYKPDWCKSFETFKFILDQWIMAKKINRRGRGGS